MEKKPLTPLAAGLVIGLASIIMFLTYYFTGLFGQTGIMAWIPAIIYIGLTITFVSMWSNSQNNFVTFGSCFGFGFKSICIATLLIFFFTLLFIYLTPGYKDHMLQIMKDQMRQNKGTTDEQIEKGMEMMNNNFMLITLGGSLFGNVITGLIGALLGASIAKKKPVDPFTQINQIGEPQS